MQIYLVGGAVRDEIMGIKSKDLDYTCVLDPVEAVGMREPFRVMRDNLVRDGYKIFLETPQYLTIRAQTPDRKETADFVLARKDGEYTDGRRPDKVVPGTLEDDLARRDFTCNAIAKDATEFYIDPFNGIDDIDNNLIRAVGDPFDRLNEDSLRAVRALRFSVTKGMNIDPALASAMTNPAILDNIHNRISDERIDQELRKMFAADSFKAAMALSFYPGLTYAMFSGSVSLTSTMKKIKG